MTHNNPFQQQFDNYISLGYVCNVASYIAAAHMRLTAHVFDRMGIPMWAIDELLQNNFEDFLLKSNLTCKTLFDSSQKKYVIDQKYYLRLMLTENSLSDENFLDQFMSSTKKRIERLTNKINGSESILFIRSEEPSSYADLGNRIIFPEYQEKYAKDELDHLRNFSDTIKKRNPQLKFKILFLSHHGQMVDNEHNIIGIPVPQCDYRDHFIAQKMKDAVKLHSDFLNRAFNECDYAN